MTKAVVENSWLLLRRFTRARIALGRAGDSLPTRHLLEFGLAHAQARDAVHEPLKANVLLGRLQQAGFNPIHVCSTASDRTQYLLRPDLGRRLDESSCARLQSLHRKQRPDVAFVIADGLSASATERHALPVLRLMRDRLRGWLVAPVILAEQARVGLGDEIGEILGAELLVMMLGERPGLSSPDSLGIYLTYEPRIGRTDAERNCISNVRPEGLSYEQAAHKLHFLLLSAKKLRLSGVGLKDNSDTYSSDRSRSIDANSDQPAFHHEDGSESKL
jgi:ethanolamine ammonia-lyase small subunit